MNLSESTVVELRKLAKEKGIKLGAGVSKAQIIEKIEAAMNAQAAPAEPAPVQAPKEPEQPVQEEKPAEPQYKMGWRSPSTPQYSTKPAYQAPVYPTRPAWQAKPAQPRTPVMQPEPQRAPAPRPSNYTPRFGPAAQEDPQAASAARPAVNREGEYRPAAPRPDYSRPAPYRPVEPATRPESYRQDSYRQDSYRQDTYRQDSFRQETFRQDGFRQDNSYASRPRRETGYYNAELGTSNPAVPDLLAAGECGDGQGLLEIHPDGYGFLRPENFRPGSKDIYVSMAQIRRFNLRTGDHIVGKTRPQREGDKYAAMLYITSINGKSPDEQSDRVAFDQMTAVYPTRRILLSGAGESADPALRLVDLIAPIGFGQRGLIVTPPASGKTTLLKTLSNAIAKYNPEAHVMVLLLDERPEEVTEFRDAVNGCEIAASTFDQSPESQIRAAEMMLERAQRLCESGMDVIILADSLTRLAKAYASLPSAAGRGMPGSMNPSVLYKAKRLFGAARALREGGSLTVLATLSLEANSRPDETLLEEFRAAANMELYLDKDLADKGIYPAIDLQKSGTRRDDLLLSPEGKEGLRSIKALLAAASTQDALAQLMELMGKTASNEELLSRMNDWIALWEKSGFVLQR